MAADALAPEAVRAPAIFQPIPFNPKRPSPYRLDLAEVLGDEAVDAIWASNRMIFHTAGDTGGVKSPEAQALVARGMEQSFEREKAAFFYHLGDIVYYMGEKRKYFDQFYDPYEHYPAPIFAIPGNHDGAIGDSRSLDGFEQNFCAPKGTYTEESMDIQRMAMCQPYAYWCLDTPLAYFIGLYTNVPEGGEIDDDQRQWFQSQLAEAPKDKTLILALHHPIYSFDNFHSGSPSMAHEVEDAINKTRRVPNLILTAHVHNYQRIEKRIASGTLPILVVGNGGFWNLHNLTVAPGHKDPGTSATLEAGTDKRHGFATIEVTRDHINGHFTTVPKSLSDPESYETFDRFNYRAAPIWLPEGEAVQLGS